jgi:carnitine-CoA ligase
MFHVTGRTPLLSMADVVFGSHPALDARFAARFGARATIGAYGSTEAGFPLLLRRPPQDKTRRWCGTPRPGYAARIVDDQGTEVADGQIGELEIRVPARPLVMLEYLGGHGGRVPRRLVPVPDAVAGQEVALAVVPRDASAFDPAQLYERLRLRLPRAFLPTYIVICADLPRTTTSKVRKIDLAGQLDLTTAWRPARARRV